MSPHVLAVVAVDLMIWHRNGWSEIVPFFCFLISATRVPCIQVQCSTQTPCVKNITKPGPQLSNIYTYSHISCVQHIIDSSFTHTNYTTFPLNTSQPWGKALQLQINPCGIRVTREHFQSPGMWCWIMIWASTESGSHLLTKSRQIKRVQVRQRTFSHRDLWWPCWGKGRNQQLKIKMWRGMCIAGFWRLKRKTRVLEKTLWCIWAQRRVTTVNIKIWMFGSYQTGQTFLLRRLAGEQTS